MRTIATRLLKIARLVENAPSTILEDDKFKKKFESARQLLGFKAQEDQQLTFSQQEDAYWGDPEFLNTVDDIVRAVQKRTYLNNVPSFSLGLRQEEQNQRWDDVSAVAREYSECEQRQGREDVQVANNGGLRVETTQAGKGEVGEQRAHVGERAQQNETEIATPTDEFLFPIIASGYYYMIHFDSLCERFEAIDNSFVVAKTEDKYGVMPRILQTFLSKFLTGLKSTYKAQKIAKLKVKRMRMPWRDNHNKIDCGVFLMRHMETFGGQLVDLW
nr:uncharacterized protein LOC109155335 [Ipomoea batatas]